MKVLVTGAAGFIGHALALHLKAEGHDVIAAGHPAPGGSLAQTGVECTHVDICDRVAVFKLVERTRPQVIVHTAAVVGVAASVGGGLMPTVQVNVAGSINLFDAVNKIGGVHRLIDLSSEEYYGNFVADPQPETDAGAPVSPYGISKFTVERLGGFYAETTGLPYVAARLSWVYGPGFPRNRLPEPWLRDIAAGRDSRLERGGDQRVDLTYIDDVVRGLTLLIEASQLKHRIYNIATGRAITVLQLAKTLQYLYPDWNVRVGVGVLELAEGVRAAQKGALDLSRIQTELSYEPRISLQEGLETTLQAIKREDAEASDV